MSNTLTIIDEIPAVSFTCRAHRLSDGVLVGEIITTSPTADIPCLSNDPVYVVVIPNQGERYRPMHAYSVGDLVFPADVITTPYYYQCINAVTSGSSEPTWATIAGNYCDDNGVTDAWLCVELSQPAIQCYMTLTPESWGGGLVWDGGKSIWDSKIANWT